MTSSCQSDATCEYCYVPPGPVLSCAPCVPCQGTDLVCGEDIPVVVRLANTACMAILSLDTDTDVLNAQQGPLVPAVFNFTACGPPVPETSTVSINGLPLYYWVDSLTPNLIRLGTSSAYTIANAVNWGDPDLGLTTCSTLPFALVFEGSVPKLQQLQWVVKGDTAFHLRTGDLVLVIDITQGWGDIGAASLTSATFVTC